MKFLFKGLFSPNIEAGEISSETYIYNAYMSDNTFLYL